MDIAIIAAVASNGVIGDQGALPWRLPGDMRFFRAQTMGHHVVMGRRTWASLGRALAGRVNLVVSSRRDLAAAGAIVVPSLDAAIDLARGAGESELYVIGGASLYREALPRADRIYLTRVDAAPSGDTFFPELVAAHWREVARLDQQPGPPAFEIVLLERAAASPDAVRDTGTPTS